MTAYQFKTNRPIKMSRYSTTTRPQQRIITVENLVLKDDVSDLCFSYNSHYLAITSWDGAVNVLEFNDDYSESKLKTSWTAPSSKAMGVGTSSGFGTSMNFGATSGTKVACLRCVFRPSDDILYFSTSIGEIYSWDLSTNNKAEAIHSEKPDDPRKGPIVCLKWNDTANCLVGLGLTSSMSNALGLGGSMITLASESSRIDLDYKPIALEVSGKFAVVVGTNGSNIIYCYDLSKPLTQNVQKVVINSPLTRQFTSVACGPIISNTANHPIIIASNVFGQADYIEGGDHHDTINLHINASQKSAMSSNSIIMIPGHKCAVSAGSDGSICFVNLDTKKTKSFSVTQVPLTKIASNPQGTILAISSGYDWSLGYEMSGREKPQPQLFVRQFNPSDYR